MIWIYIIMLFYGKYVTLHLESALLESVYSYVYK